jgi:hypothetical protein
MFVTSRCLPQTLGWKGEREAWARAASEEKANESTGKKVERVERAERAERVQLHLQLRPRVQPPVETLVPVEMRVLRHI